MHNFMNLWLVEKGVLALAALALIGTGVWYMQAAPAEEQGGVFCTADAMQCPDGSYVGRTGPNCEFVCPVATTTPPVGGGGGGGGGGGQGGGSGSGGFAEYTSGIRGTVLAGPTCPVERIPPDPACADKPVATNIWISRKNTPTQVIATTYSNKQGEFQLSLPPGEYVIQAGSSGTPFPRCSDTSATVGPTGYTAVAISCDTGIR